MVPSTVFQAGPYAYAIKCVVIELSLLQNFCSVAQVPKLKMASSSTAAAQQTPLQATAPHKHKCSKSACALAVLGSKQATSLGRGTA